MALEREQVADALPGYEIGPELGRGAWGVVLSGRHRSLARDVAIKQLPRAFAADQTVRARFVAEGRALAALDHPHVVPVFDFIEKDGLCLLVMELLPNGTVWSRFLDHGFSQPAACATTLAAAAGLHAAHQKNVLHRDVKPENLMFSADGVLKVTDFGIAKVVGGDSTLATRAGEVVGTPAYIAPEQARGAALSPATDVYALATVLYELLSGQLPFPEEPDAMALLFKHAYEQPAPLDQKAPNVPAAVVPVIMQGLATAPADRYPSAESFALALAGACTGVWGPGWLAGEGIPVMGAAPVVAVTERLSFPPVRPTAAAVSSRPPSSVPSGPPTGLLPPPPPLPAAAAGPTVVRPPPLATLQRARETVVRPAVPATRAEGGGVANLQEASPASFVPVQRVVKGLPKPLVPLVVAMVAFALAVGAAFVGLGGAASPDASLTNPSGAPGSQLAVKVDGVSLPSTGDVRLDLSKPVLVEVSPGAPAGTSARLSFLLLGHSVYSASAPVASPPDGAGHASIYATSVRYLLAGRLAVELSLVKDGLTSTDITHQWRFTARTAEAAWVSASGAVVVVLVLFSAAYLEQFARSLWRGQRRVSATAGLVVALALLSVAAVGAAWLTAGRQPTLLSLIVSAALGAVSGLALAPATVRAGRRSRSRQRMAGRARAGALAPGR